MKTVLLISTILLVISCRKPQAVFQRSLPETSAEQPRKFNFKINPIKIKSKSIRLDSVFIHNNQNLTQKIDNQFFMNDVESKQEYVFVEKEDIHKQKVVVQSPQEVSFSTMPFVLTLGATMLFALMVSINVLIAGGGISSILWTISSLLGIAGLKQKQYLSQKQIDQTYNTLIISFLALMMILITSLVLAI
jgi:hypothetical protein